MSKSFRIIVTFLFFLATVVGCKKEPVGTENGNGTDDTPTTPVFERYVKGKYVPSSILRKRHYYSLFLPASYENDTERTYPVVYFLHGIGESQSKNWSEYISVIKSLESAGLQEMIYVFPDGFNSYYCNTYNEEFRYMDMFIEELVPHIDKNYRTIADREHRAVTGYSMGGFGAAALAIRHPETFGMSAPMSLSLYNNARYTTESQSGWDNQWGSIFGGVGEYGEGRLTDYYKLHCPFYAFNEENKEILSQVKWFIHCGDDDTITIGNDSLHVVMRKNGFDHEFRMNDGAHTGSYWRSAMRETLPWMQHVMNGGGEWTKAMGTISLKSSPLNEDGVFLSQAYKDAEQKDGTATYFTHNGLSKEIVDKCIGLLTQSGSIFQYAVLPCDLSEKPLAEWILHYKQNYEVGKSIAKSQVFAIGEDAGLQSWVLQNEFRCLYLINADLAEDETTITAQEDKFYYMDYTDDSPYYEDAFALYVACKNADADFEYRKSNGLPDKEEELLLAIQNSSKKFKY